MSRFDARYFDRAVLWRYRAGWAGFTTERSTPATLRDRSGVIRTAGPGVLRTTWEDGRPYALVEGGATNGIRNPRAEGAVVGPVGAGGSLPTHWGVDTDGGLTWGVVGTGVEDGLPYVEFRVHGTPTSTVSQIRCEAYGQIAAAAGQTWTGSAYARFAGGSLDGIGSARIALQERTGSTFRGQTMTPITLSATRLSAGRVAATRTLSHAETTDVLLTVGLSSLTVGVPVDITLRVGGPQMEPGSVATALTLPPEGTLAASTRDRDLVSVPYAHAPGSLAVLTAGREAGLGAVGQAHEWQIGASTDLDARALRIRRDGSEETLRLWLGSGSARVQSAVPIVPHGAEYQRLALLDVQGTEARVRLMQRHREPGGAWVEADGGWSSPLDVSALLAQGWQSPHLTIGNAREGSRAGRLQLSDMLVLDGREVSVAALTWDRMREWLP